MSNFEELEVFSDDFEIDEPKAWEERTSLEQLIELFNERRKKQVEMFHQLEDKHLSLSKKQVGKKKSLMSSRQNASTYMSMETK